MERKADGLVLKSTDYRENDKLLTILTAQYGKITAVARGVKKAGAKLRFIAQPFCFGEFVFAEKSGRHTVISAFLHDGFYELRESMERLYAASAVCEIASVFLPEGEVNERLFVSAVTALRNLTAEDPSEALLAFLQEVFLESGLMIYLSGCMQCGKALSPGRVYFNFETGSFSCAACHAGTPASFVSYDALRKSAGLDYTAEPTSDAYLRALRLLSEYLTYKTEFRSRCLREYIRLLEESKER